MVFQRIGIHLQEFMTEEGFVFVRDLDFVQLPLEVSLEVFLVFRSVVAGEAAGAAEQVVRHVIAGIEAVVGVVKCTRPLFPKIPVSMLRRSSCFVFW